MNGYRTTRFAVVCLLLLCWTVPSAAQEAHPKKWGIAHDEMRNFLRAWLDENDEEATMKHFAATERSLKLAPNAVWRKVREADLSDPAHVKRIWDSSLKKTYWDVLKRLRIETGPLETVLAPIDPDLANVLVEALRVRVVIRAELLTAFVAHTEDAIYAFDGGYGDVAAELHPTENTVLTMIADFSARDHDKYNGPFVSFWAEDEPNEWRIQALGAAPEASIWRDGR